MRLPDEFLESLYYDHRRSLLELVEAKQDVYKVFHSLTRSNPCVITYGSEEFPNGAIKSVGFVPKKEYLEQTTKVFKDFMLQRWNKIRAQKPAGYQGTGWRIGAPRDQQIDAWKVMLRELYLEPEEAERKMDFTKLVTNEGFRTHTWSNIKKNNRISVLYWLPPAISFDVRCTAEIYEEGPYKEFVDSSSSLTHGENPSKMRKDKPAYVFNVEAVFNNSITPAVIKKM